MGEPLRVLLVEDSADDAALVLRELERGGFEPTAQRVETEQGMAAALQLKEWDAVLSDHALPAFSAPAALAVLKDSGRDVPFIVVSGAIGEEAAVALMRAGAHDYVMKDNLARLAPAVRRELREAQGRRERARLEEEVRHAAIREQQRLGQELHDGLTQQLTAITFLCGTLSSRLRAKGLPEATEAERLEALIDEANKQARVLALGLFPVDMARGGLAGALQRLADDTRNTTGLACQFTAGQELPPLGPTEALHLYRIAQEALHNAVRHAQATRIELQLEAADGRLVLTVRDDGIGMPESAPHSACLGLKTMRHRADTIGAALEAGRHPSGGTAVICSLILHAAR